MCASSEFLMGKGIEINNSRLRQDYIEKQEELADLPEVKKLSKCAKDCMEEYENSWCGPCITTYDQCLGVDDCVSCVDNCISESYLDVRKAHKTVRNVHNACFIEAL